jgi:DNA-binding beta-propeller fold protein YncE
MACLLLVIPATGSAERLIGLAQLPGGQGCIAQPGDDSDAVARCAKGGRGLIDANDVAVAPDGKNVYVAASSSSAVASFARDPASGRISEINCVSANGTSGLDGTKGACADGDALGGASSVTVSPDGKFAYSTSYASSGVGIFARNPTTGALKQVGCVRSVRTCTAARALGGAAALTITPDGKNAYLAAPDSDAVSEFARDADTGALSFIGCVSDDGTDRMCVTGNALRGADAIVASPDGKNVYVAAHDSNSVLTFARDSSTGLLTQAGCVMDTAPSRGSCVRGRAISGVVALTFTKDGRTLFAAAARSDALSVFARNPVSGTIKEVGCVSEPPYEGDDGCVHARPLSYPTGVAVTPDGSRVYVSVESGLTAFARDRVTGGLKPIGCLTYAANYDDEIRGMCGLADGIADASDVAVSPDGQNVYVTSWGSDAIAVFAPGVSFAAVGQPNAYGTLSVHLACPQLHASGCSGRVTLTTSGSRRLQASTPYHLEHGRWGVIHLRLTPALRASLAKHGLLHASLAASDSSGATAPFKRTIDIHRPAQHNHHSKRS